MTGLKYQREALVASAHLFGHFVFTHLIYNEVGDDANCDNSQHDNQIPYPRGNARLLQFRVEPLVLNGCQFVVGSQLGINAVQLCQQIMVVGKELILSVGQVNGV